MPADKPGKIQIREFLYPGHHDELLRVLHEHNRRAGNQLVLSISEACVSVWPLSLSDYEPPSDKLLERNRVKFTIREDRHPNLFHLYHSIGLGSKGQIFCNLFNRHQMQRAVNFESVNEAVAKMHERQLEVPAAKAEEASLSAAEPALKVEVGPTQVMETHVELEKVARAEAARESDQKPAPAVIPDPFAGMPPMTFS
ncbi:hypothetical protein ABH908_000274 [Pseudomonas frederiksbergensis]|uniref:hypothetical protein n=1 Tax=Pseudomonas TaxID=286 RepID=UPI003D1F160A